MYYFNSPLHVFACGVSSSSCLVCGIAGDCVPVLKAVAGDCFCRTPGSHHWVPWSFSSCVDALPGSLCHPGDLIPCSSINEFMKVDTAASGAAQLLCDM